MVLPVVDDSQVDDFLEKGYHRMVTGRRTSVRVSNDPMVYVYVIMHTGTPNRSV
jgi:hypothetical protein